MKIKIKQTNKKPTRFRNNRISNFFLTSGVTPPASSPGIGI
jgi:hypothetical protein